MSVGGGHDEILDDQRTMQGERPWQLQQMSLQKGMLARLSFLWHLFILVVEMIAIEVRNHAAIKGITLSNTEIKISRLADDTSLLIKNTYSIKPIVETLQQFTAFIRIKGYCRGNKIL